MNKYPERRNEARFYFRAHIIVEESGVYFIHKARLVNFNSRGLYFETDLLLTPEAKIWIGIYDLSNRLFAEDYVRLPIEIVWRNHLTEVSFNYGYGAIEVLDDEPKNLRKNHRKAFSKLTYFALKDNYKYYKGIIKNLSRGGAFIETNTELSNETDLKLVVPGPNKYILIESELIHFKPTGFGVRFKDMSKIENVSKIQRKITETVN